MQTQEDITDRSSAWAHSLFVLIVAVIYCLTAKFGLSLAFGPKPITAVWPPTGIALATLLLFGIDLWPGIALGAFAANISTSNETIVTAFGIALGNTLEAYVGASLLRHFNFKNSMTRLRDVFLLIGCAAISTTLSATIGNLSLSCFLITTPGQISQLTGFCGGLAIAWAL